MKTNETITNLSEDANEFSPVVAKNYRVIRAGLVDSEYKVRVGSEDLHGPSGLRYLNAENLASFPVLPDAVESFAYFNIPRPKEWSDGIVGVRWHLMGDTSSTNNVRIRQTIYALGAADTLGSIGAGTFTYTYRYDASLFTVAMPATKWTRKLFESDTEGYCTVTNEIERIYVRLIREGADGSDDYAGNLMALGAEMEYQPRRSQS